MAPHAPARMYNEKPSSSHECKAKPGALSRLPISTTGDRGPGSPCEKTHGSILTMDPQHHKALAEVLAQSPTDNSVKPPPPPQTTKESPPLQRRPSLDGGAARRAAQDVAAVEATAARIAEERGDGSTTATLRLVSRLLAQDETICRCRGSEVSGGGTTRQGADERFRIRVESRQAAAQMLEAIQLRTATQQAAASPQVVRKVPATVSPVTVKKRSLSHRLLKSKLQGSMAKAAFSSGGKAQATKRFEKHLGARLDAPSCENIPGLENGSSVLCWKNREWVPGHVKAFREKGELDNESDEVLIGELGKDDTSWKWIATTRARGVPLHAIDATRGHLTMTWVVSFSSLRPFGPNRDAPRRYPAAGGRARAL